MDYQGYSLILLIINIRKLVIKLLNFKCQKTKNFCWLFYIVKITEQLYISILLMKIMIKLDKIFIKYSKVFWTMSFCSSTLLNNTTMLKNNLLITYNILSTRILKLLMLRETRSHCQRKHT